MEFMTDIRPDGTKDVYVPVVKTCQAGTPFACLSLGGKTYEIAPEVHDDPDAGQSLAFQLSGTGQWRHLDRTVADGWTRIGADILLLSGDVFSRFLNTHAVRMKGDYNMDELVEFDTLGTTWWARLISDNETEVRVGHGEWVIVELMNPPASPKDRVIRSLAIAFPEFRETFASEIDHWAYRIATGVQIQPMM